jgi:hypothetical protein
MADLGNLEKHKIKVFGEDHITYRGDIYYTGIEFT